MTQLPKKGPRVSAKALILRDGQVLTIRCIDAAGPWYLLPGGGQDHMEPLEAALRRECREEVSVDVIVHGPVMLRDYIGKNHEFANEDGSFHQLEVMFLCELAPGTEPSLGHSPDKTQDAAVWLPVAELHRHRIYPKKMIPRLQEIAREYATGRRKFEAEYLGDAN
ncbi:MAG TPA: NUDIX domain-containing protein [Planctomycetota bacterium]|nr:NUDIX domain-containing protein [Planctomycetota bacterium]